MAGAADGLGSLGTEQTPINVPVADPSAWATAMNNLGIMPLGLPGQQLVSDSICIPGFDPSLGIMTGITPINPLMAGISLVPPPPVPAELPLIKEIIHCKSCTLFPQNPNLPPPSTRERPPGCKTVFVGGLPENANEEIIREVFDQCGEITAIRKSKKNFCHIRFTEEFMVDKAIYLSGYRMRIGSSTDKKDSGRLHVDFAQARDDLYEWECKQRLLAREERHRRKMEEERLRPPSPPPIMHYSEHEASVLADRLKDDSKFTEAITVLLTWIDRGEELRNAHSDELMGIRREEEMEMSDDDSEENSSKKMRGDDSALAAQACALKEENDSLRWQLDAYRNEVELLKQEQGKLYRTEEDHTREQQLQFLQQTVQSMQQQLLDLQEELKAKGYELEHAKDEQRCLERELAALKEKLINNMDTVEMSSNGLHEKGMNGCTVSSLYQSQEKKTETHIRGPLKSEKEALLLGIISTFLHVHPFGANIEYLWSYIQRLDTKISAAEIERLMVRLPRMFKQEFTGVGATLEKRWKFCGFEGIHTV
nr:PREDICTED: ecto-NOX disulfide-thiol exchanger 1 isoform X4 [Lepisosteus oculatus]